MIDWYGITSTGYDPHNPYDYYCVYLCPYCGGNHRQEQCARIEEIEYYQNGQIKRVKLKPIEYDGVSVTITYSYGETWVGQQLEQQSLP